jgi:hypothetical protein
MLEHVLGKVEVSAQIGERLDEALQLAENEVQQRKGMQAGYQAAGKAVAGLLPHIDKAHEEGEFNGLEGIELRNAIKKWVVRATEAVENLYKRSQAEEMVAHGKATAMKTAVTIAQKYHDAAAARATQLTAPPEPEEPEAEAGERRKGRRAGEHPGTSPLDERRVAASKAESAKFDADAAEKVAVVKKPTKKRATKKRATKKRPRTPKKPSK